MAIDARAFPILGIASDYVFVDSETGLEARENVSHELTVGFCIALRGREMEHMIMWEKSNRRPHVALRR